mgnify:CR=1 FL=1
MATIRFADKLIRGTLTPTKTGERLVCILEDWRLTGLARGQVAKLTVGGNEPHRRVVESVIEMTDNYPAMACVSLELLSISVEGSVKENMSHDSECFSRPTF